MTAESPASLRVYRLATATRPARQVCTEAATRAGHWHDVGDRLLYAYETEELAALSLSQITRGAEPPRLVHETLYLPEGAGLHAEFRVAVDARARRAFFAPGAAQLPYVNLCARLRQHDLLALWVTSPYAVHQRTVLINVEHAAFADVRIVSNVMSGDSFFDTGPGDLHQDSAWATTHGERFALRPLAGAMTPT